MAGAGAMCSITVSSIVHYQGIAKVTHGHEQHRMPTRAGYAGAQHV